VGLKLRARVVGQFVGVGSKFRKRFGSASISRITRIFSCHLPLLIGGSV
jgi:hypothetical protein